MSTASLCRLIVMCICTFLHCSLYQGILCNHFWLGLLCLVKEIEMGDPNYKI